jgi:2-hydroxy-3-oxopropionate reductase
MGSAITRRLLERGWNVSVYDLDVAKLAPLVDAGASGAVSVAAATAASRFIILSLNHADIVRAAVFGENGVLTAASPDRLLIDMSSIDPAETARMSVELKGKGRMAWVDCPLSGGAPGALSGKLTVMAGGAPDDFERAREVMADLCANYTLMGASGASLATSRS